jgi:hypothetical protein
MIAAMAGRRPSRPSPLRAAARGALAGVAGTLALDLVWFGRHRRGGGEGSFPSWEVVRDLGSWEDAPAPGRMGRLILERATGRPVPVERAAAVSNAMHWAYGTGWTAGAASGWALLGRRPPLWHGPAFGALVWASDYVTLPLAGIYAPIWRYDAATLWKDLSAHLVFGTAADLALRGLSRRG